MSIPSGLVKVAGESDLVSVAGCDHAGHHAVQGGGGRVHERGGCGEQYLDILILSLDMFTPN